MSYYDPWSHAIKIFFTRLFQFIVASLLLGLLVWYALLRWYLEAPFIETTRLAINTDNFAVRSTLGLCLVIGTLLTAWLFTCLIMRRPPPDDRLNRGARIVYRDNE